MVEDIRVIDKSSGIKIRFGGYVSLHSNSTIINLQPCISQTSVSRLLIAAKIVCV